MIRSRKPLDDTRRAKPAGAEFWHLWTVRIPRRSITGRLLGAAFGRNGQQIFHPVAHFPRQQLMTFLSLLAAGNVEENSVHDTADDIRIVALATGRHPPTSSPTIIRKSIS